MKVISNVRVHDIDESLIASGYPMRTEIDSLDFCEYDEKDLRRGAKLSELSTSEANGAHEQFLDGITVSFDLTFTMKAWVEAERYRFLNFVSSQSNMHRVAKFNIAKQCIKYVEPQTIELVERLVREYDACEDVGQKKELYLRILYNLPAGIRLTARMVTNYRCLKNIYHQRRDHRLPEWQAFCDWIETLPLAKELLLTKEKEGEQNYGSNF